MKKAPYEVPENLRVRLIIDTDCACEGDDQPALAHQLMTPKFEVRGVTAAHYNIRNGSVSVEETMLHSYAEAVKVIKLMGLENEVSVKLGCKDVLPDEHTPVDSEASRFIIEEAMRDDPKPLFIAVQGAITNVASAYLMEPRIAERATIIWIGGGTYPAGEWEYNAMNDIHAANVIMNSEFELWQVPKSVYAMMKVSFAELYDKVAGYGDIGRYIFTKMQSHNEFACAQKPRLTAAQKNFSKQALSAKYRSGEMWQVGDSPVVGLMLADHEGHYTVEGAPLFDTETGEYLLRPGNPHKIRVYNYVDVRFILDDFYAKLHYYFG